MGKRLAGKESFQGRISSMQREAAGDSSKGISSSGGSESVYT